MSGGFDLCRPGVSNVGVGLMSMLSLQIQVVKDSNVAYSETQSTLLLQEIVEVLRTNKTAASNGEYNVSLSTSSSLPAVPADRFNWFSNLNNVMIGGKASINCDSDANCVIKLQHENSGVAKTQSLVSLLFYDDEYF